MVGNSFKPFFFGRFEVRGDEVYLTGRFTMLGLVKAFMTFWFGGVLAFGIALAVSTINMRPTQAQRRGSAPRVRLAPWNCGSYVSSRGDPPGAPWA
jgi:hypothetical protein